MNDRVLILGLGNEILRDDGVGLVAARRVAQHLGDLANLETACVATIDLLPILIGRRRVVVLDAYLSPADLPGTFLWATPDTLPRGFGYRSGHTLPFGEMLRFGADLGLEMPAEMIIHGLCADDVRNFGTGFTPAVEDAWRPWADGIAREELGCCRVLI